MTQGVRQYTFHFLCPQKMKLSEAICMLMKLSLEEAQKIMEFGAAYHGNEGLPEMGVRNSNLERCMQDKEIPEGDYLRLHYPIKRYHNTRPDLQNLIVFENEDFLILNKPPGLPVHATLDNWQENILYQLSKILQKELFVTQRLDHPTQGLMVIAKTKDFQRLFNSYLREKLLTKKYKALVQKPQALGIYKHYMMPASHSPKVVKDQPEQADWQECLLEVEACQPHSDSLFELSIKLITGRAHQIRAQLSYLQNPILGDTHYGGEERDGFFGLQSYHLEFPNKNRNTMPFSFTLKHWLK